MQRDNLNWAAIPSATLNFPATFASGQAFRWRVLESGAWIGVIGSVAVKLIPEMDGFWWQTYPNPGQWEVLNSYFNLDVNLNTLFENWTERYPPISEMCQKYAGLRILNQPTDEVFFSFLCACNNNVIKVRRSVNLLAERYGEEAAIIEGVRLFTFPDATAISAADEALLRVDKWGFRAPRLIAAARYVAEHGDDWFELLRMMPLQEARTELTKLHGIGAKLADCICLFGLGHHEAVPVDTHIWQIAVKRFRSDLIGRSLTPRIYAEIEREYTDRFGDFAGWAQQYLFFAELKPNAALNSN